MLKAWGNVVLFFSIWTAFEWLFVNDEKQQWSPCSPWWQNVPLFCNGLLQPGPLWTLLFDIVLSRTNSSQVNMRTEQQQTASFFSVSSNSSPTGTAAFPLAVPSNSRWLTPQTGLYKCCIFDCVQSEVEITFQLKKKKKSSRKKVETARRRMVGFQPVNIAELTGCPVTA